MTTATVLQSLVTSKGYFEVFLMYIISSMLLFSLRDVFTYSLVSKGVLISLAKTVQYYYKVNSRTYFIILLK